ncbi:uncharacterized protein B0I36DRAFT_321200 [Microdochium trichocladiopsis]|uniref:Uncharacterized protein n=1 Tax=Microdochium trichocladiopsis TaxID=1682393 RepID=A0A9P8Y9T2_9PEZI|nr:uncharacterized protein B0I36DRAFT_321200 [Microdochium trichocladiopsis]KAH7033321.1 hypothetical protein B0I36DRAFT_321200 [Microdochium trichocladiopsis]
MAPKQLSIKRTMLLSCSALVLLASLAAAQNNNNPSPTNAAPTTGNTGTPSGSPTGGVTNTNTNTRTTSTARPTETVPNLSQATQISSSKTSAASSPSAPAGNNGDHPPPLPTLPGSYNYPPPAVPPTNNAPYMKPNSVPEGTFFIAVGAILGAVGAAILVWRAIIACLLHRSVKKAALAQTAINDKATFPAPPAPFYKYTDHESSLSLGQAGAAGRGVRRTQRGPVPSSTPSQANLFFSPTAPGANMNGNRESRFLPSGFYAAGSGAQQIGTQTSISLSNLRPDSRGHARAVGHSPPESPGLMPHHANNSRRNLSTSTLNLNRPVSGRAPSAYLEDLLDDQPEQFPPPHIGQQQPGRLQ